MGGIEYDARIAEVAHANGCDVTVSRIQDVSPMRLLSRPDVLWASPPCTNASQANARAGETEEDREMARATAHWIETLAPPCFVMENVSGYRHFDSFAIIRAALDRIGYWSHAEILNAADFGVPQTRKRLILRAVRADLGWLPPLPAPEPWRGWYEAIEDLLPTLPASQLAAWQIARLPEELTSLLFAGAGNTNLEEAAPGRGCRYTRDPAHTVTTLEGGGTYPKALLTDGFNASRELTVREDGEPSFSVCAGHMRRAASAPKALLLDSQRTDGKTRSRTGDRPALTVVNYDRPSHMPRALLVEGTAHGIDNKFTLPIRRADEPTFTIRAADKGRPRAVVVSGTNSNRSCTVREGDEPIFTVTASDQQKGATRALLEQARCVALSTRALARLQSFPDAYGLPDNNPLACRVIGNAVPPRLAEKILAPFAEVGA